MLILFLNPVRLSLTMMMMMMLVMLIVTVISTTSDRDKEAQTSSNGSSLFVHNDGPLAKAWKAASSFC